MDLLHPRSLFSLCSGKSILHLTCHLVRTVAPFQLYMISVAERNLVSTSGVRMTGTAGQPYTGHNGVTDRASVHHWSRLAGMRQDAVPSNRWLDMSRRPTPASASTQTAAATTDLGS